MDSRAVYTRSIAALCVRRFVNSCIYDTYCAQSTVYYRVSLAKKEEEEEEEDEEDEAEPSSSMSNASS
jgi:hypothetical protein